MFWLSLTTPHYDHIGKAKAKVFHLKRFASKVPVISQPATMAENFSYSLFVEGEWDPKTPKLKNKLTIYFQSKKSNGGDCCVELLGGQKATVSFKTEEVRQNVLQIQRHEVKLGQKSVKLNVYLSPAEASATQESQSSSDAGQTGESQEESSADDKKKKPSAEGKSEETKDEEPAKETEVLGKRSAVLENIDDLGREFLVMLVENVLRDATESEDFDIEIIPESNCAVITFTNKKDANHFILSSPDNTVFRKKNLEVRPLEMTTKVKVEELPSNLNADYLLLYFEKFGQIETDVEMLEDEQSAIITFENHASVNTVLKAQHLIKKQPIKIFPYYDSLTTALYGKDRPTLRLPETFTLNINKSVWSYLQENQRQSDLIKQEMSKHFCKLYLEDPAVKISPLASLLHQGPQSKKLLQTWREKASAEFTAAMSKYKSLEINIQRDAWAETEAEILKTPSVRPVTLVLCEGEGMLTLAGLVEDVRRAEDDIRKIVNTITRRIQREKGSVADEVILSPSIYEIVILGGLELELSNSFPKMDLNYHSNSQKLTLYGLKQEVLESKNKILEEVLHLNRSLVEVDQSILEFLSKSNAEELSKELFLSQAICASLEIKENQAMLLAKDEKTLKKSKEQLNAMLSYKYLDIEDPSVLRRAEWHDLVADVNNTFNSEILTALINTSGNQVVVSGFADSVETVMEQLFDYVQENSIITRTLQADKIVVRFIEEQKKDDWFELVKNKVNVDFKDDKISLSGPRALVFQFESVFKNLLSSVHQCNLKVNKPGAKKFFKSRESMYVNSAKNMTGCLIELVDDDDGSQAGDFSAGKKGVLTPEGVEIVVSQGDMCFCPVDVVVNTANEKLEFNGQLSKALLNAAGPQLKDACDNIIKTRKQLAPGDAVLTGAGGRLRCKYIIHAVSPHYDRSNPQKAIGLLKKAVTKSLNFADLKNNQSIAIPAISSGNLGFPLNLCADTIVEALKEFLESNSVCLKKIYLVDNNSKTVEAFEDAVENLYRSSSTQGVPSTSQPSQKSQVKPPQNVNPPSFSVQGSSKSVKTNEGLTFTLSMCNIETTSVDVVVNSISADLSLNHGAIPKAILSVAGSQLQTLLNQQVTGQGTIGAVYVTAGCNLKNKLVFHAVAPHYNNGQGTELKDLEGMVDKCLDLAEQQKQGSIVFPAIGTGALGFPKDQVASLMLDSVLKFSKNRKSKHVQEVMFALHPQDTQTIQVFTDSFNKKFNIQQGAATPQQSKGIFSAITSKSGFHETTVGGVVLQVATGDITKEKSDVIVNSSNDNFTLKAGVSKAILDAAGSNVEAECQQLGAQQNAGLIMTQPGSLKCKKIIHISANNDPVSIQKRVTEALKMAGKQNFTSVSFPAFGTGQGGVNPGQVADAMLDAVVDFVTQTPQSSVKLVRIVIFQAPMLTDFHQSMQKKEGSGKQKQTWLSGSKGQDLPQQKQKDLSHVIKSKVVNPACFTICGPSKADVEKAKQWIEKLITDDQTQQKIGDSVILSLSDDDIKQINKIQQSMDVSVRVEPKSQGAVSGEDILWIEGLTKDVLMATTEIQNILKKAREEVSQRRQMELICELVDWQYEQGGQYLSFDQGTNLCLEEAIKQNSSHVDITLQGQKYRVTLPDGPAVSASGGRQMNIRRVDKLQVIDNLPQEWVTMKPTELCKEAPLQVGSTEYNNVLSLFQKTCKNPVLKITRIQNPGMWKKYQSNKNTMEIRNGHKNNERQLFHGTREDTIKHININGFNRSYAGLNATVFGKGTYFAVNSSYSSSNTYSVPNAQGQKNMYLCRVLTGDFTLGNGSMNVPPAKPNSVVNLYDTVVDNTSTPTIFVVFRDDHAYPEYLITFT